MKVELLAPAGNMASAVAAINSGCDAIYLAGPQYGARAYADNFSEEELLEAENALSTCNFKLIEKINLEPSVNFIFTKTNSVDSKYPRNFGQIKKKPL